MKNEFKISLLVGMMILFSLASVAKSNEYQVTFHNKSGDTYYLFVENKSGADPIILKDGEKQLVTVKETGHVYIGSDDGIEKLITQQVYPVPGVVITDQEEGFSSNDLKENGTEILVTFEEEEITLKNTGKPIFPQ